MTDVQRLLDALSAAGVEFVVAGGVAMVLRGAPPGLLMDLDALERAKRAAGRARDLLDLAEIAEIRRRSG